MTDADTDDIEARLQAAGERWRAAEHDLVPVRAAGRPWLLLTSAALVVAALVSGGVALWSGDDVSHRAPVTGADAGIESGRWQARSVLKAAHGRNRPADVDAPLPASAYLRFRDGRFTGSDGCNTISGTAVVHRDTIVFGPVSSTEIACGAGLTARADVVHEILTGTVRYSLTSAALVLSRDGAGVLFLSRPVDPSSPDGAWRLESTGVEHTSSDGSSGSGVGTSAEGRESLTVRAGGRFVLQLRCTTVSGRLDTDPTQLTGVRSVPRKCAPLGPSAAEETFVGAVFTDGASYGVEDGVLTVTKGDRSAVFSRTP